MVKNIFLGRKKGGAELWFLRFLNNISKIHLWKLPKRPLRRVHPTTIKYKIIFFVILQKKELAITVVLEDFNFLFSIHYKRKIGKNCSKLGSNWWSSISDFWVWKSGHFSKVIFYSMQFISTQYKLIVDAVGPILSELGHFKQSNHWYHCWCCGANIKWAGPF